MDRLICDLLEYGRLAHVPLPLGAISLEEPLRRVLADLTAEIKVVRANSTALEAILSNLLSNALKFVPAGTKPHLRVRAEETERTVRLSVEDNGIGIDPKYQDRVFRVFERLQNTDQYPGTGIGLAIVQKAAQRLNASVGVESTLGEGSRFWIDLPKGGAEAAS